MKGKMLLVLYTDGTLSILAFRIPESKQFQKGARFFECDENLPLIEISEWYVKNFQHSKIKEIPCKPR
jgi:hypothetical protein